MSEPSLEYGPNPALSAQPGVGVGGYSEPEYPEATPNVAVPTSDHALPVPEPARPKPARKTAKGTDAEAEEPKAAEPEDAGGGNPEGAHPVRASTRGETRRP